MVWAFTVAGFAGLLLVIWRIWKSARADRDELVLLRANVKADALVLLEVKHERDQHLAAIRVLRVERDTARQQGADMARRDPGLASGYLADSLRDVAAAGAKADPGEPAQVPGQPAAATAGERR